MFQRPRPLKSNVDRRNLRKKRCRIFFFSSLSLVKESEEPDGCWCDEMTLRLSFHKNCRPRFADEKHGSQKKKIRGMKKEPNLIIRIKITGTNLSWWIKSGGKAVPPVSRGVSKRFAETTAPLQNRGDAFCPPAGPPTACFYTPDGFTAWQSSHSGLCYSVPEQTASVSHLTKDVRHGSFGWLVILRDRRKWLTPIARQCTTHMVTQTATRVCQLSRRWPTHIMQRYCSNLSRSCLT